MRPRHALPLARLGVRDKAERAAFETHVPIIGHRSSAGSNARLITVRCALQVGVYEADGSLRITDVSDEEPAGICCRVATAPTSHAEVHRHGVAAGPRPQRGRCMAIVIGMAVAAVVVVVAAAIVPMSLSSSPSSSLHIKRERERERERER